MVDHLYIICSHAKEPQRYESVATIARLLGVPYTFIEPSWQGRDEEASWSSRFKPIPEEFTSKGAQHLFVTYERLFARILEEHPKADAKIAILESDAMLLPGGFKRWKTLQGLLDSSAGFDGVTFMGNSCQSIPGFDRTVYTEGDVAEVFQRMRTPAAHADKFGFIPMGVARCTDSMIWSRAAIQTVYPLLCGDFSLPIDHHFSKCFKLLGVPAYWLLHPIFNQGSQNGTFRSSLR